MIVLPSLLGSFDQPAPVDPLTSLVSGPPVLWLDATDASTLFADAAGTILAGNGVNVRCWKDKSGGGRHVTQSGASALGPVHTANARNGQNALLFDGTSQQLSRASTTGLPVGSAARTCYTVLHHNAIVLPGSDGVRSPWCYGGTGSLQCYGHFSINNTVGVGQIGGDTMVSAPTAAWLLIHSYNAAAGIINVESLGLSNTNATPATASGTLWVGNLLGLGLRFKSYFAFVLVYPVNHTLSEKNQVLAYLNSKFAL